MDHPGHFFIYFCLFKPTLHISQQIYVKNVHPVYSAEFRTHDLQNMSLLPWPLDQGSYPKLNQFYSQVAASPSSWSYFSRMGECDQLSILVGLYNHKFRLQRHTWPENSLYDDSRLINYNHKLFVRLATGKQVAPFTKVICDLILLGERVE